MKCYALRIEAVLRRPVESGLGIVVAIVVFALAHELRRYDRPITPALVVLAFTAPLLGVGAIAAIPSLPLTVLHNAATASLVAVLAIGVAQRRGI